MKKLIPLVLLSLIPLSGCASSPTYEPKYDELDLIHYQTCLDKYISSNDWTYTLSDRVTEMALLICEPYLPTKQ